MNYGFRESLREWEHLSWNLMDKVETERVKSSWAKRTMDAILRWDHKGKLSKHHYNIVFETVISNELILSKQLVQYLASGKPSSVSCLFCQVSLSHIFLLYSYRWELWTSSASSHVKWPCTTIVLWFCSFVEFCPYSPLTTYA